ncbi:MAG: hypothetical protein MRT15_05050 [archaeon YNP-LCB-003-016]|nr:hypothetical protein [Candidatus Culexarchaeum yellowstonense]
MDSARLCDIDMGWGDDWEIVISTIILIVISMTLITLRIIGKPVFEISFETLVIHVATIVAIASCIYIIISKRRKQI